MATFFYTRQITPASVATVLPRFQSSEIAVTTHPDGDIQIEVPGNLTATEKTLLDNHCQERGRRPR